MLLATLLAQTQKGLGSLEPPSKAFSPEVEGEAAAGTIESIVSMAIGAITIAAGLYFILVLLLAAFNWLSAGGDSGKVTKARDSIIQGLIGLVIVVAAYAVIGLVGSVVGLRLLNPGEMLLELAPTTSTTR